MNDTEQLKEQVKKLSKRVEELELGLEWVIGQLRKKKLLPPPG